LRASKSFQAPVKNARPDQALFNPESVATLRTFRVVTSLHFLKPGPQVFAVSVIDQSIEGGDSGRPPDKKLNPTGIAGDAWFVFLRDPDLARFSAYRARKHSLSV
jgi:hypothetical protein